MRTPLNDNTQHPHETDIYACGRIRTHSHKKREAPDPRFRLRGHWVQKATICRFLNYKCYPFFCGDSPKHGLVAPYWWGFPIQHTQRGQENIHALSGFRARDLVSRAASDLRLWRQGFWNPLCESLLLLGLQSETRLLLISLSLKASLTAFWYQTLFLVFSSHAVRLSACAAAYLQNCRCCS